MVEEKQLSLVVAEVLAERQGLVDDFLGAAHGQRGHLHELFKGRAMTVDRGVVEVRAEFPSCVLGVAAHENMPAQADDGLFWRAMPVVRKSLTVKLHQGNEMLAGPEDMAGKKTIAVIRRLLGDFRGTNRAMPDKGRHVVQRSGKWK